MGVVADGAKRRDDAIEGAGAVEVGDESVAVSEGGGRRVALVVCNDGEEPAYLALGEAAVASKGIRLAPEGGSIIIDWFTGAVNAVCAEGKETVLTFTEV